MPFNQKPQKFNAKINSVTIGSGDKTVTPHEAQKCSMIQVVHRWIIPIE